MAAAKTTTAVTRTPGQSVQITTPGELYAVAEMLYKGGLQPPGIDNPNKVAAVIMAGLEVGLAPTQALGSIMLTNGRLSIYGDGAMALVRASGLLESIEESVEGEGEDRRGVCKVKRKGEAERTYTFSIREANQAGLIERARGKDGKGRGPWVSYPDRMLVMRPRGFAFRDIFPDVLRGLVFWEEAQDTGPVEVTVVSATANAPQLTAAPASSDSPPAGDATPASPPQLASPPAGLTDEQKVRLSQIRVAYLAGKGLIDPAEQAAAWKELLAGYGVESALQFTRERADAFIAAEGPKNDPFTHPRSDSSKTT